MLRAAIDALTGAVALLNRNHVVHPPEGVVKVNVGCGLIVAPGWLNIDSSLNTAIAGLPPALIGLAWRASASRKQFERDEYVSLLKGHSFVHYDIRYGLPFPAASVDFVYSSHMLEHVFRGEAEQFLHHAQRVLRPGGTIRVCVPDLAYAIDLYRRGEKEQALSLFFKLQPEGEFQRHRWMYDFELLSALLERAGFSDIRRCAYREGNTPDLDLLDNRPEQTLYVEAYKS